MSGEVIGFRETQGVSASGCSDRDGALQCIRRITAIMTAWLTAR